MCVVMDVCDVCVVMDVCDDGCVMTNESNLTDRPSQQTLYYALHYWAAASPMTSQCQSQVPN